MQLGGRGVASYPLDELDARRAGERSYAHACGLIGNGSHQVGVRVAERTHADAADEVQQGVAIDVGDQAAGATVDGNPAHGRISLHARGNVQVLAKSQCATLWPRHCGAQVHALVPPDPT
jgi:hypothetical protein